MRTGTVFSLALFPPVFLFQRILQSDVVFLLTDHVLDDRNHVNKCVIRCAVSGFRKLVIPASGGSPADETKVRNEAGWQRFFLKEVSRAYHGLKHADKAVALAQHTVEAVDSRWLTDYLMPSFMLALASMGWQGKTVVRGDTTERRCFVNDSSYLLHLCLEHDCDRLLVGRGQQAMMHQRLFRRNEIDLSVQKWENPYALPSRDSVLDAVARYSMEEIAGLMQARV